MIEIVKLQQLCSSKNVVLTEHARQRLVERKISIQDILQAIMTGKIIKKELKFIKHKSFKTI